MKKWIILDSQDNLKAQVLSEEEPSLDNGYDMTGLTAHEVEEFKPVDSYKYESGVWIVDLSKVRARAISKINYRREALQAGCLTDGVAKMYVYSQKSKEVDEAKKATGQLKVGDYPFAEAQAEKTGQSVAQVIQEFELGRDAAVTICAEVEANAQQLIKQISVATEIQEIETLGNAPLGDD